jgi:tRNA acetyltransferase TAN1
MMNLIITCARHLEGDAEEEIIDILDELGDSDVKISVSSMSGIITVQTKLDPIEVVRKMKETLLDEPWSIRYCLRVIPIQKVVETNIEEIEKTISSISDQIEEKESYRILIEKRNSDISSKEIITKIANGIKNKVSLDFPDKIILIEILGIVTGISILKKSDILSLEKTKRSMSE